MGLSKIPISFKVSESDLHSFIKSKRDVSCYIKDLVEADMNSNNAVTTKSQLESKPIENNDFGLDF